MLQLQVLNITSTIFYKEDKGQKGEAGTQRYYGLMIQLNDAELSIVKLMRPDKQMMPEKQQVTSMIHQLQSLLPIKVTNYEINRV